MSQEAPIQLIPDQEIKVESNQENTNEDDKIDVQFGAESDVESEEDEKEQEKPDLSKYTVVDADHLDEDTPIRGQEFCLFSFMSPEGIMNCNVRAVKFRGAFSSMEEAEKKARELEKTDKYFKIFIGDSGKWLDFDPPVSRVDIEKSSNKEHQKILDVQRKQRMDKINSLAGKHKEMMDKKDKGKTERITEAKKAGAANDAIEKQRAKKQEKAEEKEKQQKVHANPRDVALGNAKARLRQRLEKSKNKKTLEKIAQEENVGKVTDSNISATGNIEEKIKVVGKVSEDLEDKKSKLAEADKNIEKIKQLMAQRRTKSV
jgi:hypothetical protein